MKNFYTSAIFAVILIMVAFTGCSTGNADGDNADHTDSEGQSTATKSSYSTVQSTAKPSETPSVKPADTPSANPAENGADSVEEQITKMSVNEKIGQMVIAGFEGYTIDDNVISLVDDYHVGGFILFSRNVENPDQLLSLINSLKTEFPKSKIPLFVSVDEEGGHVSRMPAEIAKLPSSGYIGKVNNNDYSYKIGGLLAEEISAFGFNMDFAPVLDINSNPDNPVIGDRSFGNSAELVSRLGVQTMKGIQNGGIIPVVKHFPGHGDTSVDSHLGLPTVSNDMNRLGTVELVPFMNAIKNGADAVMVAHILLDKIDPANPASMSKIIITDILRKQSGFNGVVISDDMTMGAIVDNYKIGDAAVKAVNAGSDIILVCHGYENEKAVLEALKKSAADGSISKERLNQSVYRILKLKQKYKLTNNTIASVNIREINDKISAVLDH